MVGVRGLSHMGRKQLGSRGMDFRRLARVRWLQRRVLGFWCRSSSRAKAQSLKWGALLSRFHTDPSGTFVKYGAKAIGSGSEGAQTALQEGYRSVFCGVPVLLDS